MRAPQLKAIVDHHTLRVVVTGSSALRIEAGRDSLAGRITTLEIGTLLLREIAGLRFWNGDPTVRLLEADEGLDAMLLERCEPGTMLRSLPEEEQDLVVADLLRRLWSKPPDPNPFRPLSAMIDYWVEETRANEDHWPDAGFVAEGLEVFQEQGKVQDVSIVLQWFGRVRATIEAGNERGHAAHNICL